MQSQIRVLVAHPNRTHLRRIANLLQAENGITVVGKAPTGKRAFYWLRQRRTDVLLLDLGLRAPPALEVLEGLQSRKRRPQAVVLVPSNARQKAVEAIKRGARGVIYRKVLPEELLDCIRAVYIGELSIARPIAIQALDRLRRLPGHPPVLPPEWRLTARERELIHCVAIGLSNRQIAQRFDRTLAAVNKGLRLLYKKLRVKDRRSLLDLVFQPEQFQVRG